MLFLLYRTPLYLPVYQLQLELMLNARSVEYGLMSADRLIDHSLLNTLVGVRLVLDPLIHASTPDELIQTLRERSLSSDAFVINYHRISHHPQRIPSRRLLGRLAVQIDGEISFDRPHTRFLLVETSSRYYLTRQIQGCSPPWADYAQRPHAYSAALSTELAGLAVNLVAKRGETLIDPTCGSGTIVYEALSRGVRARGSDLKWQWVTRARENLSAFGFNQAPAGLGSSLLISQGDARSIDFIADAIVANLPYGRQVSLSDHLLKDLLTNIASRASRFAFFSGTPLDLTLNEIGYHSVISFNLTRQTSHPRYLTLASNER